MKKKMIFVCLTLAMLAFPTPLAFADDAARNSAQKNEKDSGGAALYAEIPDKGFPVPMLDETPVPYKHVALPEEGYAATSYVYTVSDSRLMESYKKQLRQAGFVDQGRVMSVESLWKYDRKSDGLALMVEMGREGAELSISMYVNDLSK